MRRALVVGNWKMHGTRNSVDALLAALLKDTVSSTGADIAVCPTYLHIDSAVSLCSDSAITVGAQDCSQFASGAYTGEVAAPMLADSGCRWVILGHSERRQYHGEAEAQIAAKLASVIDAGMQPILCVGETREQREAAEAEAAVAAQIQGALSGQSSLDNLVIAYEPVWAIGTGLTASPQEAQAMHAFIREQLKTVAGLDAQATRILYGGSVKAANAAQLFAESDIDGALVGGAALVAADFAAIVAAAAS